MSYLGYHSILIFINYNNTLVTHLFVCVYAWHTWALWSLFSWSLLVCWTAVFSFFFREVPLWVFIANNEQKKSHGSNWDLCLKFVEDCTQSWNNISCFFRRSAEKRCLPFVSLGHVPPHWMSWTPVAVVLEQKLWIQFFFNMI